MTFWYLLRIFFLSDILLLSVFGTFESEYEQSPNISQNATYFTSFYVTINDSLLLKTDWDKDGCRLTLFGVARCLPLSNS